MIEAMACGTPVVGYRQGSVPEVIDDGVTGFLAESIEESARALDKIQHFDRKRCRQVFEERFSVERMTRDYVQVYEKLLAAKACRSANHANIIRKPSPTKAGANSDA